MVNSLDLLLLGPNLDDVLDGWIFDDAGLSNVDCIVDVSMVDTVDCEADVTKLACIVGCSVDFRELDSVIVASILGANEIVDVKCTVVVLFTVTYT